MYKSSDNNNGVILFWYITVVISTCLFSCGPRTGIHHDESEHETDQVSEFKGCGNASMESQHYGIATHILGISGDGDKGRKLFKQNCLVCHTLTDQKLTGPGLAEVFERIPEPKTEWLRKYILNSEKVRLSGDVYAKKLHKEYGMADMTVFEGQLTDQEINDLMIYMIANTER